MLLALESINVRLSTPERSFAFEVPVRGQIRGGIRSLMAQLSLKLLGGLASDGNLLEWRWFAIRSL